MSDPAPGIEAWKAHTSAFDRVKAVASTASEPRSASAIAEEAHVAENTARNHLERLVDLNVLLSHERGRTTVYAPDPLHTRMQTLRDLLDEHSRDELVQLKVDLQSRIDTLREEYDVESPDALRGRAADSGSVTSTREIQRTARDWELLAYRLSILEDAIENFAEYSRDFRASA